ncbi:MAG: ATP-binding protein [bacterium]
MNPFTYGNVVRGKHFADREDEIKTLKSEIKSGQNVVLISPRRYGKTSLVVNVLERIGLDFLIINLELMTSAADLANFIIRKSLSLSSFEKIKNYLKNLRIQPAIKINPETGEISVAFTPDKKDLSAYIEDALEFPEKIARSRNKKIVLVFDEFQEVRRISGTLERKMRAIFQHHSNVSYIFIGSQEHMIADIFQNRKNPFYKFGKQIVLGKIPEDKFRKFILSGFKKNGINAVKIIDLILERTENHPYYTQQLCHEIFNLSGKRKELLPAIIKEAANEILTNHSADYMRWWREMDNTEKKLLIGLTIPEKKLTSSDFLKKSGIVSPSTASSAIRRLLNEGAIIEAEGSFKIEDPFWKKWIAENRK